MNTIVGDADLGRARVDLASAPPAGLADGDSIRLSGSAIAANNGLFEIADVSGNSMFLRETLVDESSSAASAQLSFDGDRYEFIEVTNAGATALQLGAVEFSQGVDFAFPPEFTLAAGERAAQLLTS